MGTLREDLCAFMIKSLFFLEREMSQTEVVETIKTRILCSVTLLRKSCRS
jgi:hypothetical protein